MLLLFILICYGMTQILVYGTIFERLRERIEDRFETQFMRCPMCVGFWVGVLVNSMLYVCGKPFITNILIGSFLAGCLSSGTSYALCMLINDDGLNLKNN
jgi:hypothetical protein